MRVEWLVIISLIAMISLAGCIPLNVSKTKTYTCSDGTEVLEPAQCEAIQDLKDRADDLTDYQPIVDETPETEVEKPKSGEITEDAAVLINKFNNKVKDLKFGYVESPRSLPKYVYLVSREEVKVFVIPKELIGSESIDTVYLDLEAKTATGYCEEFNRDNCPDRDKAFEGLVYEDYEIETPFEWIDSIESAYLSGINRMLEGRNVHEMIFTREGIDGSMYVDDFYGVPVEISWNGVEYAFRDLAVNSANKGDFEHQSIAS